MERNHFDFLDDMEQYATSLLDSLEKNGIGEGTSQAFHMIENVLTAFCEQEGDGLEHPLTLLDHRMKQTKRLLDSGAPVIKVQHEIKWLQRMIKYLDNSVYGIEPALTADVKAELEKEMAAGRG